MIKAPISLNLDFKLKDKEPIYNNYTYDERLDLFNNAYIRCTKQIPTLFNEEEALEIVKSGNLYAYPYLSERDKMKYLEDVLNKEDGWFWFLIEEVCSFSDESNRKKVFEEAIKRGFLSDWDSYSILCYNLSRDLNYNNYLKLVSVYGNVSLNEFVFLDVYNIIKKDDLEKYVVSVFENSNKKEKSDFFGEDFEYCLSLIKRNKLEFVEILAKNYHQYLDDRFVLKKIIKSFDNDKKLDVVKMFIDNNLLEKNANCAYVFELVDDSDKIKLLKMCADYFEVNNVNGKSMLVGYALFYCKDEKVKKYLLETYIYSGTCMATSIASVLWSNINPEIMMDFLEKCFEREDVVKGLDLMFIFGSFSSLVNVPSKESKYPLLLEKCVKYYGIKNKDNFYKLIDRFGYITLRYLEDDNFINLINFEGKYFDRFLDIFSESNVTFDMNAVNTVINSILQRDFVVKNSEDYNIFSYFQRANSISEIEKLLNKITFNKKDVLKNKLTSMGVEYNDFLNSLLRKERKSLDLIHYFTNNYIAKKREVYCQENKDNLLNKMNFDVKYQKGALDKFIFSFYNRNEDIISLLEEISFYCPLNEEEKVLFGDVCSLWEIMEYKRKLYKGQYVDDISDKQRRDFRVLNNFLNRLDDDYVVEVIKSRNFRKLEELPGKKINTFKPLRDKTVLDIIEQLDLKQIKENLLVNDELYNIFLNDYVKKYKFIAWNDRLDNVFKDSDLDYSELTFVSWFQYFYKIYPLVMNKSFTSFIDYGNLFGCSSSKYSLLFGGEDYRLLSVDPQPMRSGTKKLYRLNTAVEYLSNMYNKKKCSVPSFCEEINLSKGDKIKVLVGDFTDCVNLTTGERTGSCLRIGGAFEDLFYFCLKDEEGFLVIFKDPSNDKFVSRVAGVRVGNTVFFNELRNSVLDCYDNKDLVEGIRFVADKLVELSKDEQLPITNVVITTDYAMCDYGDKQTKLNIDDMYEVLFNLPFNYDGEYGYVLKGDCDFDFNSWLSDSYKTLASDIKYLKEDDAIYDVMARIHLIDQILDGNSLEDIELNDIYMKVRKNKIKECYYNNEFYVCKDEFDKLHSCFVKTCDYKDEVLEKIKHNKFNIRK